MSANTISFIKHVNNSLNPHRWMISIFAAIVFSPFIVAVALGGRLNSDRQMLSALSPYLATLVESSDRPDLLRVVQSVSEAKSADVVLVQGGNVLATNKSTEDLDMPFKKPQIIFHFSGLKISSTQIISSIEVRRPGFPSQKDRKSTRLNSSH